MDKHFQITPPERQFGLCYLLLNVFVLPRLFATLLPLCFPGISMAGVNFCWHLTNFIILVYVLRRFLLASLQSFPKQTVKIILFAAVGFCCYWVSTWLVSLVLGQLSPDFANINDQTVSVLFSQNFLLMAISTILFAPVTEEILYRGLLFGTLYEKSKAGALLVSSLLFAFVHVSGYLGKYQPETLLLCFLQYLPAGLCLGWAYGKSRNLLVPILIHMVVNTIGILALR